MENILIKDSIKYASEYGDYRIVITALEKGIYVDFKVYEVDEQDIENMLEHGLETTLGSFSFGAWISYKHIFTYYGREKESSSKYHVQLNDLESLKNWNNTIFNVCKMMQDNYC